MNKQLILLVFALTTGSLCRAAETEADFYVSTSGSDNWSGTLATPNAHASDGPFATLTQARDAVRDLKKRKSADIVVLVREGTYRLDETVVFSLKDSGEGDSTITYAAYPGETPVFSSGREINGWKKVNAKLPGLPEEAQGNIWEARVSDRFLTLYDDEGMLPRSQSERFSTKGSKNEFHFPKGRLKNWPNVEDVEILVRPTRDWMMNVLPLLSVDEEAGIARTAIDATYGINKHGAWVENVLEELDKPGEWALNTKEGKVYLWPRGKSPIVAPKLLELIRVEGAIDKKGPKDIPVRNLRFRGLTFKHGERYTLTEDDAGLQHDWDMLDKDNALVRLRGAENCAIVQCHFLHSGSGAIRVDLHGMENEISGNHIEHMGGGGILLCGYGPGTKDVNKKNLVYNNHIHHVGEIYWHSPGIFLWQSGENRVANNLIHHTNYTGLIVSGCVIRFFGMPDNREQVRAIRRHEVGELPKDVEPGVVSPYLHSRNNLIENNEIHHAMQKLGDGNGIYIRGAGAGNVIRRNYVHHLVAQTPKQGAIRTDGGQMDTLIAENLIYKCTSQGMTLKLNNRFENNIIADVIAPRGIYLKIVEGPMKGASNKRNIFYSSSTECTFLSEPSSGTGRVGEDRRGRTPARMKDIESDHNLYYCKADHSIGEATLEKLQSNGVDANSQAVDPLFVDPENGDFRFRPDSPALAMGIVPIDTSKIGLRDQVPANQQQRTDVTALKPETAIQATYYVSPSGDDLNAGTEASPFKTIEKARNVVRRINKSMTGDILVVMEGGEYPLNSTIHFDEKDSGTNGHYVTYRAKAGETPVLTGGVKVTGWTPVPGTSLVQTSVTSVENFRQMYVNGSRAQRAVSSSTYKGKGWHYDRLGSEDGVILDLTPVPSYGNPGDMELVQVSNWSFHRVPVNSFAAAGTGETAIVMESPYFAWSLGSTAHNRFSFKKPFYLENAYELLDTPGEWYLNRSTDTLFYWPLSGEDMSTAEVTIPNTETLIKIRGASLTEKVENIRFDGLTIAHTTELRPSTEGSFSQQASKWSGGDGAFAMKESSDYRPKAAVYLEATDGIRFENNVFEHLGGAGLDALNGVSNTWIERNAFRDISDSAIAVGDWVHNYLNTGNFCFRLSSSFSHGTIEAQLKRVSEHDGETEMGLAKFANSGNHVKFYHHDNQWKIAKVIAGVTTVMATGPSYPVADNKDYTVKFVANDSVMEGFVNGVSQCSVADSELDSGNSTLRFALVADNAKLRFDNVRMANTDKSSVANEDFEDGAFPDWFNVGEWDLVKDKDGTTCMQVDDLGVIDEEVCAQTWIKNNTIEQTAREYWGACAISGYITDGLVIESNRIHDTKYSGITLGFGHGNYPDSTTCVNNVVRFNDISNFNSQCYDGGAIYTTGQMPESLIEYNYLHDSVSDHPLRGIQNDNGSGAIEIRYNVVENVKYPDGKDQRWIQYTQRLCHDLFAHDNYTNSTQERQNGGPDCRITDTTLYTAPDRPAIVYEIAGKTGVTVPAIVSEDFEKGASAWSSDGSSWSVISIGDHEYQADNTEGTQYSCTDDWHVNATVEAKIKLDRIYASDGAIGVIARYTDGDNLYCFCHSEGSWKLLKNVDGTASVLGVGSDTTLATGTEVDVKFVVNGSSLEGYVNGVLQCRVTDTDLVKGKSGLYSYKSKGSFDDVAFRVIDSHVPDLP